MHVAGSLLVLYALWLLLSGHYEPWLLGLGAVSAVGVVLFGLRMDVVDHESYPLHLRLLRLVAYWGWLVKEIVKSNLAVTRVVLDPALPVSPTLIRLHPSQQSDLGRVIYANSITLTPGTVAMEVAEDAIEVHALTLEIAEDLAAGEMNRRVSRIESVH